MSTGLFAEVAHEDADAGRPTRDRSGGRERMCAVTRCVLLERDLIRFVAGPDGTVVPDLKAKLPGRGIWINGERATILEAVRRKAFGRALKSEAHATPELADQVARLLRAAALGRLGLAYKAGQAVAGFAKTEEAVRAGRLLALVTASDAAEDGRRKMLAALRRGERKVTHLACFGAAEMGLALGRPDVVHAAVLGGAAGRSFVDAASRLIRFDGRAGETPALDEGTIADNSPSGTAGQGIDD